MPNAIGEYKICSKCGENKHISLFSKRNRTSDGLEHRCKSCAKAYADSIRDKTIRYISEISPQIFEEWREL